MRTKQSRWTLPAFCLLLGALMFGAFALGGSVGQGLISFGIMAVTGALFLFGRRSETLQGIGGPERDERWELIDLRAVATTCIVLITVITGMFLYEVADGQDGEPYTQLGAIGGLTYVIAVFVLRRRT